MFIYDILRPSAALGLRDVAEHKTNFSMHHFHGLALWSLESSKEGGHKIQTEMLFSKLYEASKRYKITYLFSLVSE
jgi:hypothetical protein